MDYKKALEQIKEKYIVEDIGDDTCEIITRQMLNDFNTSFLALVKDENGCHLTDFAKTCEIVFIEDELLKSLAKKHNLVFDDYYIKTPFNSMEDLNRFMEFFDDVAKSCED